jgi:hypothetical protein
VLCASKGLVLCAGAKQTKQGFGLSYNQRLVFGAWWVRCGYILHPSFSLVLGLVLRERIRCKGKGVKITNLNLDIPLYHTGILYSSCVNKSTPTCRFSTQSIKRSTISLPLNMAPCWGTIIYKEFLVCMNFFKALNLASSSGSSSMGI